MKNLSDILVWKQSFGLLPIHLKPTKTESKFVMLNGGLGDFCLQTIKDKSSIDDYYSNSWSSNTKNFVVLDDDKVKIFNWSRNKPEEVSQKQVADNFDKFYNYLLSKNFKSERDVIPFIIDIFRQFRNITLEKTNPVEALNLLFVLLTSLEDDYSRLDRKKWNLNEFKIPPEFNSLTEKLKIGINNIKPELDLIIRHSAGALFQEAQKEVLFFYPQGDLFSGVSSKIETKNSLYSSIHYTPPYLARTVVENAIRQLDLKRKKKLKIFDPACGSSEFLIEALKQLKELDYDGNIDIKGWDSSKTAVNTSNFLLKYEQRTVWGKRLKFEVKLVCDSLTEDWDNNCDLILMNPPFVSWELLKDKNSRDAVKETLGSNFNGKPNQASAFFYKSIQCLNKDGVIGCVIPSSFLTLDAYKILRNNIYDLITINLIGKLGNFVFEDALTDVSLIVGHKPKTNSTPTILWTRNEKGVAHNALRDLRKNYYSNTLTVNEKDYSIFQPVFFPIIKESWKPISLKENDLLKTIERFVVEKKLSRIEEVFNVQQGIRTGNNNVFKLPEFEYNKLPKVEKVFFKPVVDNESIKNGILRPINYVWFPYSIDACESLINSEVKLKDRVPEYYKNYLKPNKLSLSNRKKKTPYWWSLSDRAPRLFPLKKNLVSTEFGRSDSFAIDSGGIFVVERGYAWNPKNIFNEFDYYFYLAVLSSPSFDKLLSIYSKQLAGGNWFDLGKMYTSQIPIPNAHFHEVKNSDAYRKLVEIGKELSLGNSYIKTVSDEILIKYFYPES